MSEKTLIRQRMISSVLANLIRQPVIRALTIIGSVIVARQLGPEAIAIIAAITSTATTILAFSDLGITKSLARIVPDLSVRYGKTEALNVRRRLLYLKLLFATIGFVIMFLLMNIIGWQGQRSVADSFWFLSIVGMTVVTNAFLVIKRQEWIAALQMSRMATIQIVVTIMTPIIVVATALWLGNPYWVAIAQLVPLSIELITLSIMGGYDLDDNRRTDVTNSDGEINPSLPALKPINLFKTYWRYTSATYLIYICNRFVFGLPLSLLLLATLGMDLNTLGNATVAIAIIRLGWEVANVPLTNLRVPIMARLVAEDDQERLKRIQRLMVSILVLTSSMMAICMATVFPLIFSAMYGDSFQTAIIWATPISVLALAFNFFGMGNSMIRQVDEYRPVILGLLSALLFIIVGNLIGVGILPENVWPQLVVLNYVVGRAIFWIFCDLWTDKILFQWQGTEIKMRGLMSLGISLLIALFIQNSNLAAQLELAIASCFCGVVSFICTFRLFGGVGETVRHTLNTIAPPRLKWTTGLV